MSSAGKARELRVEVELLDHVLRARRERADVVAQVGDGPDERGVVLDHGRVGHRALLRPIPPKCWNGVPRGRDTPIAP